VTWIHWKMAVSCGLGSDPCQQWPAGSFLPESHECGPCAHIQFRFLGPPSPVFYHLPSFPGVRLKGSTIYRGISNLVLPKVVIASRTTISCN
jgi:hypothetical protein